MHDITQLWGMCIIGKEDEDVFLNFDDQPYEL